MIALGEQLRLGGACRPIGLPARVVHSGDRIHPNGVLLLGCSAPQKRLDGGRIQLPKVLGSGQGAAARGLDKLLTGSSGVSNTATALAATNPITTAFIVILPL